MRVLVTGATGFIGRALSPTLAGRGLMVREAVRIDDAAPVPVERAAVGAINGRTDWSAALNGVNVVIHLAGLAHVVDRHGATDASAYFEVNTAGTLALARAAAAAGVVRLVFVSSTKVYGTAQVGHILTEGDAPAPDDPYGQSKWQAEQQLHALGAQTGLQIVVVRPPLVYGPGVKGNFLRLLGWAARGVPLPLGAVRNRRSLVSLANLCDALWACAIHRDAAGNTFLVADGEDLSTPELMRRLARAFNREARLFAVPMPVLKAGAALVGRGADFDRLTGDLAVDANALRRTLDWYPPQAPSAGLLETAQWFNRTRHPSPPPRQSAR